MPILASYAVVGDVHRTKRRSFTEGRNTPGGPEVFLRKIAKL